jgi:hypothetical protein
MSTGAVVSIRQPMPSFAPLFDMTPAFAEDEYAKVQYWLRNAEPEGALIAFDKIAKRMFLLRHHALLGDRPVDGDLWEAADSAGLVASHGADVVQGVLAGAADAVRANPNEDPDRRPGPIEATLYAWTEPAQIPPRDWVYGRRLLRKFVTATVAPGGVGKSSLEISEALAMVSGRNLLGIIPAKPFTVWLWNLEDPREETARRIQATAKHSGLVAADLGNRLYVDCGREQPLVIAQTLRTGAVICSPVVDALVAQIIARKIDVLIIDPFVSCHEVAENDNGAMDMVVKEWGRVADRGNCAVELVQHTRKGELEITTESSRGGKALTDGCRTVRVVNRMTKEEADKAGVENPRLYFRTFNDKANLTPPADSSDWFKLESVDLANGPLPNGIGGDNVGVVVAWQWPDHLAGVTGADFERAAIVIRGAKWRKDVQSPSWVGHAVARALDMDIQNRAERAQISSMLKMWMAAGSLIEVDGEDDARRPRKFIEVADQP